MKRQEEKKRRWEINSVGTADKGNYGHQAKGEVEGRDEKEVLLKSRATFKWLMYEHT